MKLAAQKYRMAKLDELTPHPENPRQGDVGAIHVSIEANGFYGTLVVQKSSKRIIAGNHRYLAAQQAGATTIPIMEVDVDDATAMRILLADNRTNDLATYDQAALAALLSGIATDDIEGLVGTGYDGDDLDQMLKDLASAEESPDKGLALTDLDVLVDEPQHEVQSHQVWQLGDQHRLVCASVHADHMIWAPLLAEGVIFAPYPTPMLPVLYQKHPLLMVQPDAYLAGHVLDKYASRFGAESVGVIE